MRDKNTYESLMKTWAQSQQKLLADWSDALRELGGHPAMGRWTKTMDAWQSSVKGTLDARAALTHQWTEALANAKGTPEELRELAREGREQLQHWAEAERELWQGWFKIARDIHFRPEPGTGANVSKEFVQLWQDSAHKMIDAQAELLRRWTAGTTRTMKQE